MTGEVNLPEYEAMDMVAAEIMINHLGLTLAVSITSFRFNVLRPLMIKHILYSIEILSDLCITFSNRLTKEISSIRDTTTTKIDDNGLLSFLFDHHFISFFSFWIRQLEQ